MILPSNCRALVVATNSDAEARMLKALGKAAHSQKTTSVPSIEEALRVVDEDHEAGTPCAVVLVDLDGQEEIHPRAVELWRCDSSIHALFCGKSAPPWVELFERHGLSERTLCLGHPLDDAEIRHAVRLLAHKWWLASRCGQHGGEVGQKQPDHEARLRQALDKLQHTQSQLLHSGKMACIGHLAAGVAHEINNPVGFISSNLNTLNRYVRDIQHVISAYERLLSSCRESHEDVRATAETADKVKKQVDLDYIMSDVSDLVSESIDGVDRVRRIVTDLRDFSHVDKPEMEEADIHELLEKSVRLAANELKYKATISREYGDLPAVRCHGGKLGQVFLNLLVNASHAIEKRGTVTLRTGRVDDRVWIELSDTGCGIHRDIQSRIFEPFFTTKDVGQGTGLGLHLSYEIVKAHEGEISVDSDVGRGACFRIELPIAGPAEAKEALNESAINYPEFAG